MPSLWQRWTVKDLISLLNEQDPQLLPSLERLLPPLLGSNYNPNDLYLRDNLSRVVTAFLPSGALADRQFRTRCLDYLPPSELSACAKAVGVGIAASDFGTRRDAIGGHRWSRDFASAFIQYFGLPRHLLPSQGEALPDHIDIEPPTPARPTSIQSRFMQLKDYQFDIYGKACRALEAPRARFVIQMPTGAGKTRTAMEIVCERLNRAGWPVVVWLAHSEELCEQGMQCFLDLWPHLADKPLRAHRSWGPHSLPSLQEERASFIVGSFQKLHAAMKRCSPTLEVMRDRCALVVVDEAHMTEAPTYKEVVAGLLGIDTQVIGLTATPGRAVGDEAERLTEFYFNKKIDLPTPADRGVIQMLRDRGVLAHTTYIPIMTDIDVELTPADRKRIRERFDLPKRLVEELGRNDMRNLEITKRLVAECRKGRRVLLFSCSVEHSKFLTSILLYLGHQAGHVDGSTASSRRHELISAFKLGELDVLSNFGVLTTGFDAPKTDVVFITRPTASPVLYSQMIGRGLRGPVIGGTQTCTVIDVRDNIIGYGDADRVYALFDDYWIN